jgi:predicted transcriptional regulator
MTRKHSLGDLQFAIMQVLWRTGEATVAEVHRSLVGERGLAPTTIATMLVKMERKGVVAHRSEGRRFVYQPTVTEAEVRRSMVGELTDRLFAGDTAALVSHLISEHDASATDLEELKRLVAEAEEREAAGRDDR